jgi:hypothetical protein
MERLQLCTNCVVQKRISYVLENLSTVVESARFEGLTPVRLKRRYDIDMFVKCNRLDTRWQQYSTQLHTNNAQNNTINIMPHWLEVLMKF